jgi:hypothetical protein
MFKRNWCNRKNTIIPFYEKESYDISLKHSWVDHNRLNLQEEEVSTVQAHGPNDRYLESLLDVKEV